MRLKWWHAWKRAARHIANFQSRVLLTVVYFAGFAPVWPFLRRGRQPFRPSAGGPSWQKPAPREFTLEFLKRQS